MKGRVLVVDDDAALAEMLGIVLRGEGFEPTFVSDGDKALDAFRESRPDLVLLDVLMPLMDGFETCRRLRQLPGGDATPLQPAKAKLDIDINLVVKHLPSGATTSIGSISPALAGTSSAPTRQRKTYATAETVIASTALTGPATCGALPPKSTSARSPLISTRTRKITSSSLTPSESSASDAS